MNRRRSISEAMVKTQLTNEVFSAIGVEAKDVYALAEFFLFCFESDDQDGVTRERVTALLTEFITYDDDRSGCV